MADDSNNKGRPTQFNDNLVPVIANLSQRGLHTREIAGVIGCAESTIKRWIEKYPQLAQAVLDAHNEVPTIDDVENAMFKRACGFSVPYTKFKEVLTEGGGVVTLKEFGSEYIPANVTAGQYLLNNLRKQKFSARQTAEAAEAPIVTINLNAEAVEAYKKELADRDDNGENGSGSGKTD